MERVNMPKTSSDSALQSIVSAKLPDDLLVFVEDYRWNNRLTRSQVIIEAITDWAKTKGFVPSESENENSNDGEIEAHNDRHPRLT